MRSSIMGNETMARVDLSGARKRHWPLWSASVLGVVVITACTPSTPIYRANGKLSVNSVHTGRNISRADEEQFFRTAQSVMLSQTMRKRVQNRMKKTAVEIDKCLTNLNVVHLEN